MGTISDRLQAIRRSLPSGVRLCAVSKYHPEAELQEAYDAGQLIFGESHEQELRLKAQHLPQDIEWHFIGHLQTNKVRHIAPYISMIETVDSDRLLREINRQALKNGRVIDCLLELHIAEEATKYGLSLDAARQLLDAGEWRQMGGVRLCGIMMMASHTDDEARIAADFDTASRFFAEVKARHFATDDAFSVCSWGMSDDYPIAVAHGSNLVRVGTAIFGPREY